MLGTLDLSIVFFLENFCYLRTHAFLSLRFAINSTNLKRDFEYMNSDTNLPADLFALNAMRDFLPTQKEYCTKKQYTKYIKSIFKISRIGTLCNYKCLILIFSLDFQMFDMQQEIQIRG